MSRACLYLLSLPLSSTILSSQVFLTLLFYSTGHTMTLLLYKEHKGWTHRDKKRKRKAGEREITFTPVKDTTDSLQFSWISSQEANVPLPLSMLGSEIVSRALLTCLLKTFPLFNSSCSLWTKFIPSSLFTVESGVLTLQKHFRVK